jgi:hypothetical protein
VDQTRCIWQHLADAGASVPSDPSDLDATHLVLAAASGVDVSAAITAAMALSVEHPLTA